MAKQQVAGRTVPLKSKIGHGLNFVIVIHQEKYLKVFLNDGNIPTANSASERAIRTFCIGCKKNGCSITQQGEPGLVLLFTVFRKWQS